MKKMVRICGIFFLFIFVISGCSNSSNNESVSDKWEDGNTQQEEHWENIKSASYQYTILQESEMIEPEDPYCNTDYDGQLHINDWIIEGTPYESVGIVYDDTFFDVQQSVNIAEGLEYEAGGGSMELQWILKPRCSGETQILVLKRYLVTDKLEGRLFQISVTEDRNCYIDWYMDGVQDETFAISHK